MQPSYHKVHRAISADNAIGDYTLETLRVGIRDVAEPARNVASVARYLRSIAQRQRRVSTYQGIVADTGFIEPTLSKRS